MLHSLSCLSAAFICELNCILLLSSSSLSNSMSVCNPVGVKSDWALHSRASRVAASVHVLAMSAVTTTGVDVHSCTPTLQFTHRSLARWLCQKSLLTRSTALCRSLDPTRYNDHRRPVHSSSLSALLPLSVYLSVSLSLCALSQKRPTLLSSITHPKRQLCLPYLFLYFSHLYLNCRTNT